MGWMWRAEVRRGVGTDLPVSLGSSLSESLSSLSSSGHCSSKLVGGVGWGGWLVVALEGCKVDGWGEEREGQRDAGVYGRREQEGSVAS